MISWGRDSTACCPSVQKCKPAYGLCKGAKVDASFGWRVTATRASAPQESALQPSAIGFGFPRLVPERLAPELLVPVPVTCHPRMNSLLRRSAQISKSVPDSESASCATVKPVSDLSKRFETSRQSAAT